MMKALLVGGNSFLAKAVLATPVPEIRWTHCGHEAFAATDLSGFDTIANFALDPCYRTLPYDEARDQDLAVARRAADAGRPFVMLSTRRVYGPDAPASTPEGAPLQPIDTYGRNKARTETALRALMGEQLTILRLANIFGFEPGRSTFFGIALDSLRGRGQIVLDTAGRVRRDFLPVSDFAVAFHRILARRLTGTFNMGAGTATAIGDVASALIQGFGRGELVITSSQERDNFLLDSTALADRIGPYCAAEGILPRCVEIGKALHENHV
jgi:UDP-glucose 4-epimerase